MPTDRQYRAAAERFLRENDIVVDEFSSAIIRIADEGAYVRIDLWINDEDAEREDAY